MTFCESCLLEWLRVVLMPVTVAGLGYVGKVCVDKIDRRRTLFDVATTWRIEVFRELTGQLNDIYCYFTYEGNWLELSPDQATERKRACDRIVHVNYFLWTEEFLEAYRKFVGAAFAENQGREKAFLFRANVERHRENPRWEDRWAERFVAQEKRVVREEFKAVYKNMLDLAVRDVGVGSIR